MVSPGQIALFGLILDGLGALALAGFRIRPINKIGRYLWPRYRKVSSAWNTLHQEGEVTSQDYGSHALAFELDPPEDYTRPKVERHELKCEKIELTDKPNTPLKDQEITVELSDSRAMPDVYSMSLTTSRTRESAMSVINSNTENGFLKTGALLLIGGFGLQILGKLVQMYSIQLPTIAPVIFHPFAVVLEVFIFLVLFVIWLGKMNDPPR